MPFYTYYIDTPPPCCKCGRTTSMMNHTRHGVLCVHCVGKVRKGNKHKNTIQHAKPLRPGSGYPFVFDKMIQPETSRWKHLNGLKGPAKDRSMVRIHRKRQRRVDEFLISEALDVMKEESKQVE